MRAVALQNASRLQLSMPIAPAVQTSAVRSTLVVREADAVEASTISGPAPASAPPSDAAAVTDIIRKIGTLQFLSATIIQPRREVVAQREEGATTETTPSLRIYPTFSGKTWGLTALATF